MIHKVLVVGPLQCNCSILGDEASHEAIVVDPGADISLIMQELQQHQLTLKYILITHAHIDHIAGASVLKSRTGAPIYYNTNDLPLAKMMDIQAGWLGIPTPEVHPPDHALDRTTSIATSALAMQVIETPGHTPGSVCLYLPAESLLLAGDTLFAGSVGRTDLPGGDSKTLLQSIHHQLLTLPEDTHVLPGHGPSTTLGFEKFNNPFLR